MPDSKIAEFNEYISPDGVVYEFQSGNCRFLLTEEGQGVPPIEYITQRAPSQHGETVLDFRLQPRIIQYLLRQNGGDRFQYWDNRAGLVDILRPNRQTLGTFGTGKLRKKLPNGKIRDIDVMIESGPIFKARELESYDEYGYTETLRFIAHDPIFYDPNQVCIVIGTLGAINELTFPLTFRGTVDNLSGSQLIFGTNLIGQSTAITYTGTWFSFPTLEIIGPIRGPEIINTTLNERIKLNYNVAAGEVITIRLEYGMKTVMNNYGVNLIGTVSDNSSLSTFRLEPAPTAPNGVNTIVVNGTGALADVTEVNLAYYTRYWAI